MVIIVTIIKKLVLCVKVILNSFDRYCNYVSGPCTNGSLDLYSSSLSNAGNVRVCVNGSWFKVCGTGNTLRNNKLASVICSSIGFSPNGNVPINVKPLYPKVRRVSTHYLSIYFFH